MKEEKYSDLITSELWQDAGAFAEPVVEFCSLPDILMIMAKERAKTIAETVKDFARMLKFYLSLAVDYVLTIYDLSNYDPILDFIEPPNIDIHHLQQSLKAIHNGEKLEKYAYIGFKVEDIKRILKAETEAPLGRENLVDQIKRSNIPKEMQKMIIKEMQGSKREWRNLCEALHQMLYVFGGEEIANNPRRHFPEGKGEITANYKNSQKNPIIRAFELKGLIFPVSGKTLEKYKPLNTMQF